MVHHEDGDFPYRDYAGEARQRKEAREKRLDTLKEAIQTLSFDDLSQEEAEELHSMLKKKIAPKRDDDDGDFGDA